METLRSSQLNLQIRELTSSCDISKQTARYDDDDEEAQSPRTVNSER